MTNHFLKEIQVGWVYGMPRSGTTWLSQIFASSPDVRLKSCPLFSYEFKNALDENSTAEQWEWLFSEVYKTNSEFLDQDHLRKRGLIPSFQEKEISPSNLIIKSNRYHNLIPNILKVNKQIRLIHIVRHPCATIHSWLSDSQEFPKDAVQIKEWRSGECRKGKPGEFWGFDDWKKVTSQALRLSADYPNQHKLISYEDLVGNTHVRVREMFSFLNIPYGKQTEVFLDLSHSKHDSHKHSVFKDPKNSSDWQSMLDPRIIEECLSDIRGTELEQFIVKYTNSEC